MSRIDSIFESLRTAHRRALMPFITAGHPSLHATAAALPALAEAGADIVELGIPFSDPIADGPVIAASMHEALVAGVTPELIFERVEELRPRLSIGLIAMVSVSIINRMGAERFIDRAAAVGFDGLIVPDADTDGGSSSPAATLSRLARERGLTFTLLIAPTTTESRVRELVGLSSGFVYLLARVGITGERDRAPDIAKRVELVRRYTSLPIAVGFGISRPEHVEVVAQSADAVIVGSALVRRMGEADDPVGAAAEFVGSLAMALEPR